MSEALERVRRSGRAIATLDELRARWVGIRGQSVSILREAGMSWGEIAAEAGVSRQALMKRSP